MLKEIKILVPFKIFSTVENLSNTSTWWKRNKYHGIQIEKFILWKETSIYWKLRIKSTTCFKDQISIMLWYFSDVTINKIILKSPTQGEWPNEIWSCKWIGKFRVQTSLGAWEPKLASRFPVTFGSKLK